MTARLCRRFGEELFSSAPECVKGGSWENIVRMQRWFPDCRRSRAVIGKNRPKGRFFPTVYVLAMVGHLKNVSPTFAQILNRSANVEFTTASPTIANTLLAVRAFLSTMMCQSMFIVIFLSVRNKGLLLR